MVASNNDDGTPLPPQEQSADLKEIDGIGKATKQWLHEALDIFTIDDLVARSAKEIEGQAKADGRRITRPDIEGWLAQARAAIEPRPQAERSAADLRADYDNPNEWNELAQFVVIYEWKTGGDRETRRTVVSHKTAVHHLEGAEGGGEDHVWEGHLEYDAISPWIRQRVDAVEATLLRSMDEPSSSGDDADSETEPAMLPQSLIDIKEVRIRQSPHITTPMRCHRDDKILPQIIQSGQPVDFELLVELIGPDDAVVEHDKVRCGAWLQAANLETFERIPLAQDIPTKSIAGQKDFTLRLSPIRLEPGTYRLDFATVMEPTILRQGHFRIPFLQVG